MTCRDTLQCVHEPFGDAFYFGPERLSERYEQDEAARAESGFEDSTYRTIFERIDRENTEVGSLPPAWQEFVSSALSPFPLYSPSSTPMSKSHEKKKKYTTFLSPHVPFMAIVLESASTVLRHATICCGRRRISSSTCSQENAKMTHSHDHFPF